MNLEGQYDAKKVEDKIYKLWEDSGFFNPDNLPERATFGKIFGRGQKKFVTPIAPPNITGELHMGHALELTMQDILVRMKRMQGYKTLWIPGIDHAGIAAQNVVEKQLKKEGLSRHDLGKEKFLERVQAWKEKNGNAILQQFKKLGISADWSRTRYTRDEGYEKAVKEAFKRYQGKKWIYKGYRVINWCARCQTSISDLEIDHADEMASLYVIKYGPLSVATVRPETKFGDTAIAVNPDDERYQQYIGKTISIETLDIHGSLEQPKKITIEIPVIADKAVDPSFATGAIKVTPAHDMTDWEIAQRHKLPVIQIINEKGRLNEKTGKYANLNIKEARQKVVEDLRATGLLIEEKPNAHRVATCSRCGGTIEPLPSEQWFLKMHALSKLAKQAIQSGKIKIMPENFQGPALMWLDNLRDWNISRQLWWGHKIPVDGEEDVLDTWFSSALWPFATLGWPEKTKDMETYYPADFITSDRGILFLWQIRMMFSGIFFTGKVPFKKIYIHPTVLTKEGKRMSKSLGTGIDPVGLIEKYGTDALRFGLAYQNTGVQDLKFGEDHILMGKKFANKIWNIARYVQGRVDGDWDRYSINGSFPIDEITGSDKFGGPIRTIFEMVEEDLEQYHFGEAAHLIYDYLWHSIADKYIETTKNDDTEETKKNLVYYLVNSLKLLHPFMPFITEEIYGQLPIRNKKMLMIEQWPH
ncbi:MAG: class I tRNA ligase family protein [bacterium]|nr:class I tRNA ligase family protein [bacterium]